MSISLEDAMILRHYKALHEELDQIEARKAAIAQEFKRHDYALRRIFQGRDSKAAVPFTSGVETWAAVYDWTGPSFVRIDAGPPIVADAVVDLTEDDEPTDADLDAIEEEGLTETAFRAAVEDEFPEVVRMLRGGQLYLQPESN